MEASDDLKFVEFVEQGHHAVVSTQLTDAYANIDPGGADDRDLLSQMYAFPSSLNKHAQLRESAWYQALFKVQLKWGGSILRLQESLAPTGGPST